jgi:hypothetical protein
MQTHANDAEITPEMIEAGVKEFRANETDFPNERQAREAVMEIFAAMSRVARRRQV